MVPGNNEQELENVVCVSYAWDGESERIVDELERAFNACGISIVRDTKYLDYRDSIAAFEQRIGRGQCIVLVISDKYLRSEHCMYELLEAHKNHDLRDRIFPIVLADAHIYEASNRLKYIKHWEEKTEQLDQAMRTVKLSNLSGITADLDKYTSIRASFAYLTDLLRDMKALTLAMHTANDFSILIDAVECAMVTKKTASIQYQHTDTSPIRANKKVKLILEGEFDKFTLDRQQAIVDALAGLLRIDPTNIKILKVSPGSIVITLEMPDNAANRFYQRAAAHDFRMTGLGIKSVMVDDKETIKLQTPTIEFVNREEELRQLDFESLRAHGKSSPFTQISAPVGYGKSYLLQKLIAVAQDNENIKSKWSICYIDFSEDVNNPRQLIQDRITDTLQQDFSVNQLCNHVINNLAKPYSNGRRAVLLVLDAIEKLDSESEAYLIEFFIKLFHRTRPNPNREIITVRVILSGRKVDEFWEKYKKKDNGVLAPNQVLLTPFKDNAIEQLIGKQASDMNIPLVAEDIKQFAYEVQYLSGGHPKVIRDLVDELAREAFAIEEGYFSDNRAYLVENFVIPAANALLENIADGLKENICVLSTFRRLTTNTISVLVSEKLLDENTQGIDLLEQLSKAHLLDTPEFDDPFFRDHLMQRVLALKMAYSPGCQASYMQCNKVALEMYGKLILQPYASTTSNSQDDFLRGMQLPYFFVEWLYHAFQDTQITNDELRERFKKLGVPTSQASINLLQRRIGQDFEIVYLARNRFGKDGIATICNWFNQQ